MDNNHGSLNDTTRTVLQVSIAENLWDKAVEALNDEERAQLDFQRPDKRLVLEELLEVIEDKKQLCLRRRWKVRKRNGELVFLRDVLGKLTLWINKFREVGDVAVQYDPSHAALPWAGVRLVLQTMVNDVQIHDATAESLEQVSGLITRYAMIEGLYLNAVSAIKEQLKNAIVRLYTAVLTYLLKARRYYARNTPERIARSLVSTPETSVEAFLQKISQEEAKVDVLVRLIDSN